MTNAAIKKTGEAAKPRKRKNPEDLRFRMAYTKPELLQLLPFGHTTLEDLIKRGRFPEGIRPHPTAHKIWPRRAVEEWLEKAQNPRPAE